MTFKKSNYRRFINLHNLLLTISLAIFLALFFYTFKLYNRPTPEIIFDNEPQYNAIFTNLVYISGAVNKPGTYEFIDGMRISDIVSMAGGFRNDVDTQFINKDLNLSEKLKDEQKIYIPFLQDTKISQSNSSNATNPASQKININTASIAELDSLPGIGEATAQKIIDARPFSNIEELLDVSGIGESKYNDIKSLVSI